MKKIVVFLMLCLILLLCNISYGEFINNGNGTITDSSTGLIWQEHGTYGSYSREYANTYVDQLTTGGYTNWRLPTINELKGIKDYVVAIPDFEFGDTYHSNAIDSFSGNPCGVYFMNNSTETVFIITAQILAVRNPPWYSTDPNDFIPLKNTVWKFEWEHDHIDYFDIVTFDANITSGDDKIGLFCHNDIWNGCVFYGDFISHDGRGFICTLSDIPPTNVFVIYQFNINNDTAIGDFVNLDVSDSSKFVMEILIGTKILSDIDQNQPVEIDQNQPIELDQNQPIGIDQNQPVDIVSPTNNPSSDGGGGCFINFLL